MTLEGKNILVDSCVWVDSYCHDDERGTPTREFLRIAALQGAQLLYAVHAAKDVLYVLEHEFKRAARHADGTLDEGAARAARATALACLRNMSEVATAVGADVSDVWLAQRYLRTHHDFEDNLVLSACRRAKADYLITQDKALIAHADVIAKTPEDMLALLSVDA